MIDKPWKTYRVVRRERILAAIEDALRRSGVEIVSRPNPRVAPFDYRIRSPQGEELTILCYAFLANKYKQQNRPDNEHRFQIKYGSDSTDYHDLYIDPTGRVTTILLGVHLEDEVFIAADPILNTPTKFFRSFAVKTDDIREARRTGWLGIEHHRSDTRRAQPMPQRSLRTEAVLLFTAENFLRFVEFERLAQGLETGERLLLADRFPVLPLSSERHPLLTQFGISKHELYEIIAGSFRLKAAVLGAVAERHLERYLRSVAQIDSIEPLDQDGQPDFRVRTGSGIYTIECKNVLRRLSRSVPKVDFQKTRASKANPCSRYYPRGAFDILAACLHPITERWEFRFCRTRLLPAHESCPGRMSQHVLVDGTDWTDDLRRLLS